MRTAPIMKAAKRMCDWTRTAITTFLPIIGTSRLPIGTARPPLACGEVHDPAYGQKHVEDYDYDHQNTYYRSEGPADSIVVLRAPIEPRDGEEEPDEDGRHNDGPEGYQGVSGEEHEHLLVEEKEPLGPGHVLDGRRVRRLGERRRREIGERRDDEQEQHAEVSLYEYLVGEEWHRLVVGVVDVLLCDPLFFSPLCIGPRA